MSFELGGKKYENISYTDVSLRAKDATEQQSKIAEFLNAGGVVYVRLGISRPLSPSGNCYLIATSLYY